MSKKKVQEISDQNIVETCASESSTIDQFRYLDKVIGFSRDENGFLNSVNYVFNADNTINWRAMIKPEHLVANKDSFKNDPNIDLRSIDVTTLPDNKLLILLAGIKELAQIRGFKNVSYEVIQSRPDYVAVKCTIEFLPNYETGNKTVSFSSLADAHWDNTHSFAKNFLMAIAENRAFVRCVRSFLKIHIVGSDEIGGKTNSITTSEHEINTSSAPAALLEKTMQDYGITFNQIKEGAIKKNIDGADTWSSCEDIPPLSVFTIVSGIKNKNKK
jgi:hypothetical protein